MTAATLGGIGACDRCLDADLELGAEAGLSDRGLSGGYVGVVESGAATSTERRRRSSDLSTADAMLSLPSCSSDDSSPGAASYSGSSSPCRSEKVGDRPLMSESMTAGQCAWRTAHAPMNCAALARTGKTRTTKAI